jgi:putative ABC transport system permease protein
MTTLAYDLRHAVRGLLHMRRTAAVCILTLALGIGATTTMFSVVYAALVRPLPFEAADRLVMLYTTRATARAGLQRGRWAPREIESLRVPTTFEAVGSYTRATVTVAVGRTASPLEPSAEQVDAEIVSPPYLRLLRISPIAGRLFDDADDTATGAHPIAVIGEGLWRRRFGADPGVIGRDALVNSLPLTIVGVMPGTFGGLSGGAEIWLPTTMAPLLTYTDYLTTPQHFINLVGRLKPGENVAAAGAELAALSHSVLAAEPTSSNESVSWGAAVSSLGRARVDLTLERSVLLLLGAAWCVLIITCVNIAGLLLARAESRRQEIAIRLAIGCSRLRLMRQLLTEAVVLAGIGGAGGVMLSWWGIAAVAASAPGIAATPRNDYGQLAAFASPTFDGAALAFALGVTVATTLLIGVLPAVDASRPHLVGALKADLRPGTTSRRRALGSLVVGEIALAVLLVTAAGLLLDSFAHLANQPAGFDRSRVLTFWVNPPGERDRPTTAPAAIERMLARVRAVPGVVGAAVSRCTPYSTRCARTFVYLAGGVEDPASAPVVGRHYVSADYLHTLGVPLRAGRWLTDADRPGHPPVAVVNETAARRFWPGENPLGKRVWFGTGTGFTDRDNPVEVVGVVGDVKYGAAEDSIGPDFYTSYLQFTYSSMMVLLKTSRDPLTVVASVRRAIESVDAGMPMYDVKPLDDRVADALSRPRFNAVIVALFGGAALMLAAVGVYGVMSYRVSAHTRDIGIRLALGAAPERVLLQELGTSARLTMAGATLGVAGTFASARLLQTVVSGVSPTDVAVVAMVVIAMFVVALAAAYLPARRASAIDPIVALAAE